jgi:hypothetical protein
MIVVFPNSSDPASEKQNIKINMSIGKVQSSKIIHIDSDSDLLQLF